MLYEVITDAHTLARHGALAEVCSLLKLEYEDRRLLTMVLSGPPALDQSLAADTTLAHRIDVRVELDVITSYSIHYTKLYEEWGALFRIIVAC